MGLWCGAEHYKMSRHYVDKKLLSLSYEALKCIHVHKYTLKHVYTYSRPHEYIKLSRIAKMIIRESLYIIKGEREGNEGCCCEPVHLPDEWTCSSVKLNKWEPLASHLLSL